MRLPAEGTPPRKLTMQTTRMLTAALAATLCTAPAAAADRALPGEASLGQALAVPLVAASAATPQADYAAAPHVVVYLSSFEFAPSAIQVKAGQPIVLHLINRSSSAHDFTTPEFFAAAAIRAGDERSIKKGRIPVGGGQEVLVGLTPVAGQYPIHCSRPLHKGFGMSGGITVTW